MTNKEILIKAKELISDKKNWCKLAFAKDYKNKTINPLHPNACKFCADGALIRVSGIVTLNEIPAFKYLHRVAQGDLGCVSFVSSINDHCGHEAVMKLYDKAIELCND